jgi:hypothetical protein
MKTEPSCRNTRRFRTSLGLQPSGSAEVRDHEDEYLIGLIAVISTAANTMDLNLTFRVAREADTLLRAQLSRTKFSARPLVRSATLILLLTGARITKSSG